MRKLTTLQAQIALLKNANAINVAQKVISMCNTNSVANVVYVHKQQNAAKHKNKNVVCVTKMRVAAAAAHTSINPVTVQQFVRVVCSSINTIYFCNNVQVSKQFAQQFAAKITKNATTAYTKVITAKSNKCVIINAQNCVSFAKCKAA